MAVALTVVLAIVPTFDIPPLAIQDWGRSLIWDLRAISRATKVRSMQYKSIVVPV